jgi:hypothetical protein
MSTGHIGFYCLFSVKTTLANATQINVAVNNSENARFEFPCSGHVDDSTPVRVTWYLEEGHEDVIVSTVPSKRTVCDNGSLILQLDENDNEGWRKYGGTYKCKVSNGYSEATRIVIVDVFDIEHLNAGEL